MQRNRASKLEFTQVLKIERGNRVNEVESRQGRRDHTAKAGKKPLEAKF